MSKLYRPGNVIVVVLSRDEVVEELRGEVHQYGRSYCEQDGQVRDPAVLRTIQARYGRPSG
jgi:hypothetical protein